MLRGVKIGMKSMGTCQYLVEQAEREKVKLQKKVAFLRTGDFTPISVNAVAERPVIFPLRIYTGTVDSLRVPLTKEKCARVCVYLCFRGRYVVALGRSWHPEEFTCCQCREVLDEGGFFEEKGSVYCTKCYDNRYAPNCAKCKKKIAGVSMFFNKMEEKLVDLSFHPGVL